MHSSIIFKFLHCYNPALEKYHPESHATTDLHSVSMDLEISQTWYHIKQKLSLAVFTQNNDFVFIHFAAYISSSFFLLLSSIHQIVIILFTHQHVEGHLTIFFDYGEHLQKSLYKHAFISFKIKYRSRMAHLYHRCMSDFLRHCQIF